MILIHESLPSEAAHVAGVLRDAHIDCELRDERRDDLFPAIPDPAWPGSHHSEVLDRIGRAFPREAVLMLTPRDLFDYDASRRSPEDHWMFGVTRSGKMLSVVSTARLRGHDSNPVPTTRVSEDQYLRRLATLAMHEVGHVLTACASHHIDAAWVNAVTNARDELGVHCDDPICVMYPTVDVRAPRPELGYMEFHGTAEKRFDAGLDEQIGRLPPDWFCKRCRGELCIPAAYKHPG